MLTGEKLTLRYFISIQQLSDSGTAMLAAGCQLSEQHRKKVMIMKLKDTGLSAQDIKDKVSRYMIETYERFDFLAETAEGMYLYDEE